MKARGLQEDLFKSVRYVLRGNKNSASPLARYHLQAIQRGIFLPRPLVRDDYMGSLPCCEDRMNLWKGGVDWMLFTGYRHCRRPLGPGFDVCDPKVRIQIPDTAIRNSETLFRIQNSEFRNLIQNLEIRNLIQKIQKPYSEFQNSENVASRLLFT